MLLASLLLLGSPPGLAAQSAAHTWDVSAGQVASVAGGAAAFLVPGLLGLPSAPPRCAPCDRAHVPAFDAWAIRPVRPAVSTASDVALLGLAALSLVDLARAEGGERAVMTSLEAASWAAASTAILKVVVRRPRPVLYTADAERAAGERTSQLSIPSGHTAVAFALGASYLMNRSEASTLGTVVVPLLAVGVGVLRVVSAHHFPSDVVAGAAVGVASAWVTHGIRF